MAPLASSTPCAAAGLWALPGAWVIGQPQKGLRRDRPYAALKGSPPQANGPDPVATALEESLG